MATDFIGSEVVRQQKNEGVARHLGCFTTEEDSSDSLHSGDTVYKDEMIVAGVPGQVRNKLHGGEEEGNRVCFLKGR
jgi:glycine cleavage system aminomethyltransferase T